MRRAVAVSLAGERGVPLPRPTLALALLVLAAGAPWIATAATTASCADEAPQEETASYPLRQGTYVRVGQDPATATTETGFWEETNGRGGLQTKACVSGTETIYRADRYRGAALP